MKIKGIIASAMSAILLCSGILPASGSICAAAADSATISATEINAGAGNIISFPINLSNTSNVPKSNRLAFSITYDQPLQLATTSFGSDDPYVTYGNTGITNGTFEVNQEDHIVIFTSDKINTSLKDGKILDLYFIVPENAVVGKYNITFSETDLFGQSSDSFAVTPKNGAVKVFSEVTPPDQLISGDRIYGTPGETVEYNIKAINPPEVYGIGVQLDYDNALKLKTVKGHDDLPDVSFFKDIKDYSITRSINDDEGIASIGISLKDSKMPSGSYDFMKLWFTIPEDAKPGYYPVILTSKYSNSKSDFGDIESRHGWIRVKGDEPEVTMSAENITAVPGETICYSVFVNDNPGYDVASVQMKFDPRFTIRKESVVPNGAYTISGPAALTTSNVATLNQKTGTVTFDDSGKSNNRTGKLFSIYLTIPEDTEPGKYPVTFIESFAAVNGKQYKVKATGGAITVKNLSTVKGDANCDGKLDIADAVLLQKWLMNVPETELQRWQNADVCEDKTLDAFDLAALRRLLVK